MNRDIIERLRDSQPTGTSGVYLLNDASVEIEVLRNDLTVALQMLADWCVAVEENGTEWDDWDEYYKDAMYREGSLRGQLDEEIAKSRARRQYYSRKEFEK